MTDLRDYFAILEQMPQSAENLAYFKGALARRAKVIGEKAALNEMQVGTEPNQGIF